MARPDWRDWRDALALGAGLGAVVLGAGGRLAMRFYAIAVEQDPAFSLSGSMTVVLAGTVTGAATAVGFLVTRMIPRVGPLIQVLVFWAGSLALALRLLQPINPRRLELFLPLAAIFVVVLQLVWWVRTRRINHSSI
jgi:hypothetical protein